MSDENGDELAEVPDTVPIEETTEPDPPVDLAEQERSIGSRIYELSLEGLADQERTVNNIRGRAAPLLAGGLVGAGLLARPAFEHGHPDGLGEWIAASLGACGGLGLLVGVVMLSLPNDLGFSVRSREAYEALFEAGITTQPEADLALADAIDQRRETNTTAVSALARWLLIAAVAFAVEIGGFAVAAALASRGDGKPASDKPAAAAPRDEPAAARVPAQAASDDLQRREEEQQQQRDEAPSASPPRLELERRGPRRPLAAEGTATTKPSDCRIRRQSHSHLTGSSRVSTVGVRYEP